MGKVTGRVVGTGGEQLGICGTNPFLNTIRYEVQFNDGHVQEYGASMIAENFLSRVDEDGFSTTVMKGIFDYSKDDVTAVSKEEKYITTQSVQKKL